MDSIFVSYAHEDRCFVGEVIQKLTSAGLSIWIDKEIHHGDSISSRIVKAIDMAHYVLFFSSKHSNVSDFCIGEILVAVQKKKSIIPIKIDSSDYCDDLIVHLIRLHYVDFINGFAQDEYNELVAVLSGRFNQIVAGVEFKENGTIPLRHEKLYRFFISSLLVILLVIIVRIIWPSPDKHDGVMQIIHYDEEYPTHSKESYSEYKEQNRITYTDVSRDQAMITVIVEIDMYEMFNGELNKYKVEIKRHKPENGNAIHVTCLGDSTIINQIRLIADEQCLKVIDRFIFKE